MYPICRYMDSHPQACYPHGNQASYPPHFYPSWESPFSPKDCNSYWNHVYPSAPFIPYTVPQLPQHHFPGAYPPFPNTCPSFYISPPQYIDNQGRSHCCCCPKHSCQMKDDHGMKMEEENPGIVSKNNGSSNMSQWPAYPYPEVLSSPDHMKDQDHKTSNKKDSGFSPMIPWPTHPYPFVWFPPNHMKDHDHKSSNLKDSGSSPMIPWPTHPYPFVWLPPDHTKDKNHEVSEPQAYAPLDRWLPLDKNSLKSSRENEEKTQNQQKGEKRMHLPLPIIWMPNYDQPQESEKNVRDADASPRVVEELPTKFKITPINHLQNDNCNEKTGEKDVNPVSQICPTLPDKESRIKTIPVKHMEDNGVKKLDHPEKQGHHGSERLSTCEKEKEDNLEKKTTGSDTKKQVSPGRPSKFAPVCLRIDPLPRKKRGNGSTRSPSPPGNKEVKDNPDRKESKAGGSGGLRECMKDATMEKEVRVVGAEDREKGNRILEGTTDMNGVMEVEDRSTSKNEGGEKNQSKLNAYSTENHARTGNDLVHGTDNREDVPKGVEDRKCGQLKGNEEVTLGHSENEIDDCKKNIEESAAKKMEENIGRKCKLSEIDAVLHIQAGYRGYQVRRWEPLKKLKQIARIRDQVSSIEEKIHSLEISSEGQLDEKQKLFIGETIMNLLLQLDTIQGLHPSVREIRKSVARDLVSLQEKLEVLSNKVAGGLLHTDALGASTLGDYKNALEDVCCDNPSDLKESILQEESERPPCEVNLDYSAADKQGGAIEMFVEDFVGHNSSTGNKELLVEIKGEQTPNLQAELIGRSVFENEEPCCSETEEYTKSPAFGVGIDSDPTNVSKQQELQHGVKDEAEGDFGKDDVKADAEVAEFCEMHAKEVKLPASNMQPFSVTSPLKLEEGETALQEEEVAPLVEDLTNIQEHQPLPSSECSEFSCHYEDSASGNEALIMQNGETRQGELLVLDDSMEHYCAEVGDAVPSVLPCPEPLIREVPSAEANGSENATKGIHELKKLSGHEHFNPEIAVKDGAAEHPEVNILDAPLPAYSDVVEKDSYGENSVVDILGVPTPTYEEIADKEGDAVHPKMEIMDSPVPAQPEDADGEDNVDHSKTEVIDAPVPTSSPGVDLAEDDNIHEMPALPVEIPTPSVEDHAGGNTEVDILDSPASRHPEVANKEGDAVHPKVEIMDVPVPTQLEEVADLEGDAEHPNAEVIDAPMPKAESLDIKDLDMLQVGSTIGECSTELSVDLQVPEPERTSAVGTEHERKLVEENEILRGMLGKLIEAGNKQLEMLSSLSGRVKGLEKKVAHRRKLKMKLHGASKSSPT